MSKELYEAIPVYVCINEGGEVRLLTGEPTDEDKLEVLQGSAQILRFFPFSPSAQVLSGRGGRVEVMEVEWEEGLESEAEPAVGEDALDAEPESESEPGTYVVSWKPL